MKNLPKLYLKQIEIGPMQNFSYFVGDQKKGECFVVDPAWDVPALLETAHRDGMKIVGGLLTHTHYDHANGVEELLEKMEGKIYVHANEASMIKVKPDRIEKLRDKQKIRIGDIEIECLHTPGHTPGGLCFFVQNHLLSGDTLFINACGRCDIAGGDPEKMYESLKCLAQLGDQVVVLPGHNYDEKKASTIGDEKRNNPYYQYSSLSDFLALRKGY
ncbi:MAG: MBL fold metallo-hydrolase [Candidatus Omnitrophica bacterium]|nr:MBL fold metallo-hydrolase [Candidatus Omnitrophota bacterium]